MLKITDASYPRTRDLHPGLPRHLGGDFKSIPAGTQRSSRVHHTKSTDHFSCPFSEHITTELQEEEKGENPTEYIQTPLLPTGSRPGDGPRVAGCLGGPACTKSRENPGTCWAHSPRTWRRETEQETERGSLVQDSVTWDGTTRPSPYPGTGVHIERGSSGQQDLTGTPGPLQRAHQRAPW